MLKFTARDRLKLLGGGGASLLLAGCGGGSNVLPPVIVDPVVVTPPVPPVTPPVVETEGLASGALRDSFQTDFKIGSALSSFQLEDGNLSADLTLSQFNSVTPLFQLKPMC